MGSLAKYMRAGDGNRYTPNHNGPVTIDDFLQKAEDENRLLQEATSGSLSEEMKEALNEKYPGFMTAVAQDEVIKTDIQKFTPDLTSELKSLITFTMKLNEWTIPEDYIFEFDVHLFKNINTKTRFNTTANHADLALLKLFCLVEGFAFHIYKNTRTYLNYQKNNSMPANNVINNRAYQRFKTMFVKKSYMKAYREHMLNHNLAFTEKTINRPTWVEIRDLMKSNDVNAVIRAMNSTVIPEYQTFLQDTYNALMNGDKGFRFRVPLFLLCEFFQIKSYYGKGKELKIEFTVEQDIINF
ncbi:uncharacterized protein LOC124813356 [Hydra vulgaris]|uniref:uncharacterized protein LOC124813356 n=1 Tax=Hydra vulgaris TaxID=6087 RepID=UPI001F5E5ED6|nr:uncharacterized protein LOC124813356 [Hydra vulgaris]XP_047136221.1 uncharacterized protein LOC124813356 [Hydra vulgaris]